MMEFLEWTFQSFWRFLGVAILLETVCKAVILTAKAIWQS